MGEVAQLGRNEAQARQPRSGQAPARKAGDGDLEGLAQLLAAAFFDDPVLSWAYPDPVRRRGILPAFFGAVIDACRGGDETYATDDDVAGAICLPPSREPDEAMIEAIEEISGEYTPRIFKLAELTNAEHPVDPHYYVFFLGTRPESQSQGIGSALLRQLLEPCDQATLPAYLEASSERNKQLYLRHGFEVTGEIRLPDGPTLWPMWRDARDR